MIALTRQRRKRAQLELVVAALTLAQLGFGGRAVAGAVDGAVVLGAEPRLQDLRAATPDGRRSDSYATTMTATMITTHSQVDMEASSEDVAMTSVRARPEGRQTSAARSGPARAISVRSGS